MHQLDMFSRHLVLEPYCGGKKWETRPRKAEGERELPVWCPGVLTSQMRVPAKGRASLPGARKLVKLYPNLIITASIGQAAMSSWARAPRLDTRARVRPGVGGGQVGTCFSTLLRATATCSFAL